MSDYESTNESSSDYSSEEDELTLYEVLSNRNLQFSENSNSSTSNCALNNLTNKT